MLKGFFNYTNICNNLLVFILNLLIVIGLFMIGLFLFNDEADDGLYAFIFMMVVGLFIAQTIGI